MKIKIERIIITNSNDNQSKSTIYLRDITNTSEEYFPCAVNFDYNSPEYFCYSLETVNENKLKGWSSDAKIFQVQLPSKESTNQFLGLYVAYLHSFTPSVSYYRHQETSITNAIVSDPGTPSFSIF